MDASPRFPWWIPAGAVVLAAAYLPTLATPFDFIDDGNLVYPSPAGLSAGGHVALWWEKVAANYDHLGPFRPTLWVHWQVFANAFAGDPLAWRVHRFVWCALAVGMLLWLFRELKVHPTAALFAGALAMWNPYRNEIWTSLTLAEGVAMPYALFALVAARKAATSPRPLGWELASVFAVLVTLGCKNTFAALVPAQIVLRMWPDGLSLREAWKQNGWRALALGVTLLLPAAHFVYFKAHWHPGQYETHGPSLAQLGRMLGALKGAMSFDFLALGVVLAGAVVWAKRNQSPGTAVPGLYCAVLLLLGGIVMYLPMSMMSGRYAMPAVWGLDILFALLLTALVRVPESFATKAAWVGVAAGLAVVLVANVGRQEKFAARAKLLWEAVHHVEQTAPPNAKVAWVSGDSLKGGLNIEEGIHFQWHLFHRGRGDITIGLFDESDRPLERTELQPLAGVPDYRLFGVVAEVPAGRWEPERSFAAAFWFGRKRYDCHLSRRPPNPFLAHGAFEQMMREQILAGFPRDDP